MRIILTYTFIFSILTIFGQYPKFEIGGLSRALADNSFLDQMDTVNNDVKQDFNLVFDLAINGELNEFINFYSELRLGNSLEVFDTSSSYINLRRILKPQIHLYLLPSNDYHMIYINNSLHQ